MKFTYNVLAFLLMAACASAQNIKPNLYDSARVYYQKKDFKKAYYFYDTYYSDTTHGQSNYDTYYAAVAACHAGQPEKIAYYLQRSAKIGYDLSSYDTFANDPLNECLRALPAWQAFIGPFKVKADSAAAVLKAITDQLNDTTQRANHSLRFNAAYWNQLARKNTAAQLVRAIQNFDHYPLVKQGGHWMLYQQKVNDSLAAPFLCYIPQNYDPHQKYPLLVFLHGGVSGPVNFGNPAYEPGNEKDFLKRAFERNAFIIFPFARKNFNWLYHQQAFETILSEVARIKGLYHIDDDRVYLGGHSDGGRGAVWFALNQATPFAAFYGICYFPSVYTGNTSLRNLHNQVPFYGISATGDNLFALPLVKSIINYDQKQGGNWHFFQVEGTHGLPYRTPEKTYFLFDSLLSVHRDPIPHQLIWETDNIQNGRYYWLSIKQLDTAATPADWHTPLNPEVINKDGKPGKLNFNKHRSGLFKANYTGNTLNIETSCIGKLTVDIMAGMTDLKKPVIININGKQRFKGMVVPDKNLIVSEFLKTQDQRQIVMAQYDFQL